MTAVCDCNYYQHYTNMKKSFFLFATLLLLAGALFTGCAGSIGDADWTVTDPPQMLLQQWMTEDFPGSENGLDFLDLVTFKGCIASFWFQSRAAFEEHRSSAVISFSPDRIYKYTFFKKGSQYSLVFVNEYNDDLVFYISDLKKNTVTFQKGDGNPFKMTRVDPPVKLVRK